jgi:hypothetical protein
VSRRDGKLRRLKWGAVVVGLAVLVTGTSLWLMFQHIPSWYRPVVVVPFSDADQRVKNDWVGANNKLVGGLTNGQAFEFAVEQDRLNAWLGARECSWQRSREWLPPALSDPFVLIERDGLRVAATYRSGGVKTVVSARLQATVEAGGVRIRLDEVAGGSLGVPESWVRERLALLDGRTWPVGSKSPYQIGGPALPPLSGLFQGVRLPDTWVWVNGQWPFRIVGVRFEPGQLVLSLKPLPR